MYVLIRKKNNWTSDSILDLFGYPLNIDKSLVTIISQDLIDKVIRVKYAPNFNKLIKKVLEFLEEDGNADDAGLLLDEAARIHAIFLNMYDRYVSNEEKEIFMRKLRLLSNELKQLINQKNLQMQATSIGRRR